MSLSLHEHVWVPGAANTRSLLLLHGTGGDQHDLLPLGRMLDPDGALLSPLGNVREHGMPRFFRRLAEGVFDEEDLVHRAAELKQFIDSAVEEHGIDRSRLTACGFSNGANMAAALLLLHGAVFQRAILLCPMVPLKPTRLPDLSTAAVLVCGGQSDPIATPDQARALGALLESAGATVQLSIGAGGHALTQPMLATATDWLQRHVRTD